MKEFVKIYIHAFVFVIVAVLMPSCAEDPAYSSDYDIQWPLPTIASVSPSPTAQVSSNITITGTGLDKIMSISIDNRSMTIVEKTETTLTATLPRKFNSSAITLTNLYRRTVVSSSTIAPEYPDVVVSAYPSQIIKDQPIVITGENLDLATSIIIGSNVVPISSTNATTLSIPTLGLKLPVGEKVVLVIKSNYSTVVNDTSVAIDIVE